MNLSNIVADVTNVNPRKENHGDEHVLASDLNIKVLSASTGLDEYVPGLSEFLFDDGAPRNQSVKVSLRSALEPFTFTIEDLSQGGLFGAPFEPFTLESVKVKVKAVEPMAGNQMRLTLQVQTHPTPAQSGLLDMMNKETIVVSLRPEHVEAQSEAA